MATCLQLPCQAVHCRATGRKSFAGRKLSQPAIRARISREPQRCHARLSNFIRDIDEPSTSEPEIVAPPSPYGLSIQQMRALGLTGALPEMSQDKEEAMWKSITASAHYASEPVCEANRMVTRMSGYHTQPATGSNKRPGQKPPDLPSLLLDARIVFIGMPLVPSVSELLISELLWLNYSEPDKPAYIYINSIGSQGENGQALAFEADAHTILDTMQYIKPDIYTVNVGKAYGNAAMLLASGQKGKRYCVPNGQIMTQPPRMNRSFGNVTNMMIKANELEYNTKVYIDFMAEFTGKDEETVRKDMSRKRWYTPAEAIDYGIIDKVVEAKKINSMIEKKDYTAAPQQRLVDPMQGRGRVPAGASAEGGY